MGLQDPRPFNFSDLKDKNMQIDSKTLLLGAILLLLILISTFSLLYFLYICIRRSRLAASVNPHSLPQLPPPAGLDKATISCLPIVLYGPSCHGISNFTCKMGECSICLGPFQDGEKVKILPTCHHGFHAECVDTWLLTRSSCPLCRACVVPVESVLDLYIP